MTFRSALLLTLAVTFAGCSWQTGLQSDTPAMTRSTRATVEAPVERPAAPDHPPERVDRELQNRLAEISQKARSRVGIGAVMLETGDSAWVEREGRFATQSVYKLPIAMAALRLVDSGRLRIDQQIQIAPEDYVRWGFQSPIRNQYPQGTYLPLGEIVRYSISESDGSASDVLLDLAGGPEKVQQYLGEIGIRDFIVADSTKAISKDWETQFRNWATPRASIDLLRAIIDRQAGLGEQTTNLLLGAMTEAHFGRRRLRRGLPKGAVLAHKTGTGGSQRGVTSVTADVGIITLPDNRRILIAVYIENSPAGAWERNQMMADVAKAVCEKWYSEPDKESTRSEHVMYRPVSGL